MKNYHRQVVGGLTREELAERAGVSVDIVDKAVELGIAIPSKASFSAGDVRRVRLVNNLDEGGLPPEAIGAAIQSGDLSLAFLDHPYWERFGSLLSKTHRELSAESGVSLDLLAAIHESMGYAHPEPDDQVRGDELAPVALVRATLETGVDAAAAERQIRVWGESLRRIAESDSSFYRTQIEVPLLRLGMTVSQVMEVGSQAALAMAPLLDQALLSIYHAQSEHTWMATVIEDVEAALEKAGLYHAAIRPPAMCFLDLAGYTRLTEERGDEAAAEMAGVLGRLVRRISNDYGGRSVKWLGDGVMLYFEEPGLAVLAALEMVERVPAADLPPAHVGIETGPVIHQDGDYFGRTVNAAARIAGHAIAGQVLVSDRVMRASSDRGAMFVEIGPVELRGFTQPVQLYQAYRSS